MNFSMPILLWQDLEESLPKKTEQFEAWIWKTSDIGDEKDLPNDLENLLSKSISSSALECPVIDTAGCPVRSKNQIKTW